MEESTWVSGMIKVNEKDRVLRFGEMVVSILGFGRKTQPLVKEDLYMLMVTCTKENGKMIEHMDKELTNTIEVRSTREAGTKIVNMDTAKKLGQTMPSTKAIMNSE